MISSTIIIIIFVTYPIIIIALIIFSTCRCFALSV